MVRVDFELIEGIKAELGKYNPNQPLTDDQSSNKRILDSLTQRLEEMSDSADEQKFPGRAVRYSRYRYMLVSAISGLSGGATSKSLICVENAIKILDSKVALVTSGEAVADGHQGIGVRLQEQLTADYRNAHTQHGAAAVNESPDNALLRTKFKIIDKVQDLINGGVLACRSTGDFKDINQAYEVFIDFLSILPSSLLLELRRASGLLIVELFKYFMSQSENLKHEFHDSKRVTKIATFNYDRIIPSIPEGIQEGIKFLEERRIGDQSQVRLFWDYYALSLCLYGKDRDQRRADRRDVGDKWLEGVRAILDDTQPLILRANIGGASGGGCVEIFVKPTVAVKLQLVFLDGLFPGTRGSGPVNRLLVSFFNKHNITNRDDVAKQINTIYNELWREHLGVLSPDTDKVAAAAEWLTTRLESGSPAHVSVDAAREFVSDVAAVVGDKADAVVASFRNAWGALFSHPDQASQGAAAHVAEVDRGGPHSGQ